MCNEQLLADAPTETAPRAGRYNAANSELALDLRVAGPGGLVSGDLFRIDDAGQRTWVASFRSSAPGEAELPIMGQDRYGATVTGWVKLTPATATALQLLLFFDGRLDGLPMRRPIALAAEHVGNALRSMGLEVEVEQGVVGPPDTTFNETAMSIETALAGAGIEVVRAGTNDSIPAPPADTGWSEKDIEALSHRYAQIDMASAGFALQMLWLSRSNRSGLYGVMFDTSDARPRQSLAVFASEIRDRLGNDAAIRDRKLIQTAVHEIGHALNLAHRFEREVGRADSTSFMNYDWRYRGGRREGEFWSRFNYSFDQDERNFLCHGPYSAVVMGGAAFHSVRYWHEGDGGYSPYVPERQLPGLSLTLAAGNRGFFRFAEPVLLSLTLENRTGQALRIPDSLLDPKAGFVELLVRRIARGRTSDHAPESFQPVVTRCFEIGQDQLIELPSGGQHADNLNLTFGASGFTFAEPGTYEVRALLVISDQASGTDKIAASAPLQIQIGYPEARSDYGLADRLFQADAGRWFALGAPERLSAVGDALIELAMDKATPREIAAHVLRTGMFGAHRDPLHVEKGRAVRGKADPARFAQLASGLEAIGLDGFDPVTRSQTAQYLKETRGRSPGRKHKG